MDHEEFLAWRKSRLTGTISYLHELMKMGAGFYSCR
jgi:hypothetical protein